MRIQKNSEHIPLWKGSLLDTQVIINVELLI